jgi:hypothetical protein
VAVAGPAPAAHERDVVPVRAQKCDCRSQGAGGARESTFAGQEYCAATSCDIITPRYGVVVAPCRGPTRSDMPAHARVWRSIARRQRPRCFAVGAIGSAGTSCVVIMTLAGAVVPGQRPTARASARRADARAQVFTVARKAPPSHAAVRLRAKEPHGQVVRYRRAAYG